MKNIKLNIIVLAGLVCPLFAAGQSATQVEMTKAKSLWFHSENAAGLTVTPLENHNQVSVKYAFDNGNFKMQQQGDKENALVFNTNGALKLGGFSLWGNFSYENNTLKEGRFNTTQFSPFNDMPYYVADTVVSKWKRQSYALSFKGAAPILWNFLGMGLEADYVAATGAKQNDPRAATYDYRISVRPGFLFKVSSRHSIGLNGIYENSFERTKPELSNGRQPQPVYIMSGLGNYTPSVVGSGGVGVFFYKSNKIGGALQYGFTGTFSGLLDVKYQYKVSDAFQYPVKPKQMGSIKQNLIDARLQLMLSGDYVNKLTLGYYDKNTDGIEYVLDINQNSLEKEYVLLAKYVRSNYRLKVFSLNYDLFKGAETGYSWRAGVKGDYSDRFDEYYLPNSTLAAENVYAEIYAKKNFLLSRKSSLLAGLNVGYNKNLSGHYIYGGAEPQSVIVTELFYKDMKFLTSNYFTLGADVDFATKVSKKMALFVKGEVQWLKASSYFDNRVNAAVSVGLIF